MKRRAGKHFIYMLFFIICSTNLVAQDYIMLDGKKIPKEKLNPYSGMGYEIDLTIPENQPSLRSAGIGKNMKITSQRVFASKGMKSFMQTTRMERIDSAEYYLPSSTIKFFDEKGKLKWEKKLEKKSPLFCYLTPDGKHCIADIHNLAHDPFDETNSLNIFDENGNTILEYQGPVKYQISDSRDLVCYKEDIINTQNIENNNIIYCFDLKNKKNWSKSFPKKVSIRPASTNGDFVIAYSDSTYTIISRAGNETLKKPVKEFNGGIKQITNDGLYALSIRSSLTDTTYFKVTDLKTMKFIRHNYEEIEKNEMQYAFYESGCFVNNSYYLIGVTTNIAPTKAMIVFYNVKGEYVGHKVYSNIQSKFRSPNISLLENGSFNVDMDGYHLDNLIFPGVNTLQYLKK